MERRGVERSATTQPVARLGHSSLETANGYELQSGPARKFLLCADSGLTADLPLCVAPVANVGAAQHVLKILCLDDCWGPFLGVVTCRLHQV